MRRTPLRAAAALALAAVAAPAAAQLVHRGTSARGLTVETVAFVDAWAAGGADVARAGRRDVMTRVEERTPDGTQVTVHLLLFGPWGAHLYTYVEEATVVAAPVTTSTRTTLRALDLDADGENEIVLVERVGTMKTALDETGRPLPEPGPFFDGMDVGVRYLTRSGGSLAEHDLPADPDEPRFAAVLAAELGGPANAALQLAAADWLFLAEKFDLAQYRYQVAREWAERSLSGREVAALAPDAVLATPDPDQPAMTWIAAVRRIGALPPWYRRR